MFKEVVRFTVWRKVLLICIHGLGKQSSGLLGPLILAMKFLSWFVQAVIAPELLCAWVWLEF